MKKLLLLLIFILFSISSGFASDVKLSIEIDKNTATMEDAFQLEVAVEGVSDIEELPTLSNTSDFKVQQTGTGSQTQIINGHMSQKITIGYILYPQKEGTFQIGPAILSVQGKKYQSESIKLIVSKSAGTDSNQSLSKNFFLETKVSNEHPYVGEQVVYTFKFFTKVDFRNAAVTAMPDFKGFWKEELAKQKNYSTIINGVHWNVNEFSFALFPTQEGRITIPAGEIQGQVLLEDNRRQRDNRMRSFFSDDFFAGRMGTYRPVSVRSKDIVLNVQALPLEGKPSDFSGLVGRFSLESDLSKNSLKVGESLSYTLTLKGDGNIRDFQLGNLNFPNFKVYDDNPQVKIGGDDRLYGMKLIKKALVPTLSGNQEIIGPSLSIFNPQTKKYEILKGKDYSLTILPSDQAPSSTIFPQGENSLAPSSPLTIQKEVKLLGQDLMSLMKESDYLSYRPLSNLKKTFIFILILLSFLSYFIFFFIKNRKDLWSRDKGAILQEKAWNLFKVHEKKIKLDSNTFFSESSKLLRDYLAHKFRLEGKAMSSLDVDRLLSSYNLPMPLMAEIKKCLQETEMAQYGGDLQMNSLEYKKNFKEKIVSLVKNIDKLILVLIFIFGGVFSFSSQSLANSELFLDGNKAFIQGDYPKAQGLYEKDLLENGANAASFYNLGSAHFRQGRGHLGSALFYFRKAEDLLPYHLDIKANLTYIRSLRADQMPQEKEALRELIKKFIFKFPFSTDTFLLILLSSSLFLVLISIFHLYKKGNDGLKWTKKVLFIFFFASVIIYFTRLIMTEESYGVVKVSEAKVYSSISKESILLFTLHEASEFKLQDFSDDKNWIKIQLADGKKGWLEKKDAIINEWSNF